jgi:hypothetical protein
VWDFGVYRFAYALGGSAARSCALNMPVSVVQVIPLNKYGAGAASVFSTTALPSSLAGVSATVIGSYLITVGGYDGSNVGLIYSSHILQQAEAPVATAIYTLIKNVKNVSGFTSLAPGTYRYVVSAVFPSTHTILPNGESLPSGDTTVLIPSTIAIKGRFQAALINWGSVPGASGFLFIFSLFYSYFLPPQLQGLSLHHSQQCVQTGGHNNQRNYFELH